MDYLARTMLHGNAKTLVLALLARQDSHAYQLRWDLSDCSRGHFQLAYGRLYPLLRSLESHRLVRGRWVKAGRVRERRVYSITAAGRRELKERIRRWQQFAEHMDLVLDT